MLAKAGPASSSIIEGFQNSYAAHAVRREEALKSETDQSGVELVSEPIEAARHATNQHKSSLPIAEEDESEVTPEGSPIPLSVKFGEDGGSGWRRRPYELKERLPAVANFKI